MLTVVVHSFLADDPANADLKNPLAQFYNKDVIANGVVLEVPGPKPTSPGTYWIVLKQSLPPDLKVGDKLEISFRKKEEA